MDENEDGFDLIGVNREFDWNEVDENHLRRDLKTQQFQYHKGSGHATILKSPESIRDRQQQ
jgi:hypothetical protein